MRALNVFTLFQMGLQVHGEQWRTVGVVRATHRSVVTAYFMISVTNKTDTTRSHRVCSVITAHDFARDSANHKKLIPIMCKSIVSLSGTKLDGKRTSKWVNLKGTELARGSRLTTVLAVDEELTDLLGHCYVIHNHSELGIIHWAFLCGNTDC